jgi:hypothetical protein
VNLVAQHVSDLTRPIGARLTNRQWYDHDATLSRPAPQPRLPGTGRNSGPAYCAAPDSAVTSRYRAPARDCATWCSSIGFLIAVSEN